MPITTGPGQARSASDEPLPAPGVIALRVQLLELIDDQSSTLGVAQIERRARPRRACRRAEAAAPTSPSSTAAISPARNRDVLPLPEAPDYREELPGGDARQQVGDDVLAAEEEVTVRRLEREQPPVRAVGRRGRRHEAAADHGLDRLGRLDAPEPVRAEVGERVAGAQRRGDQRRRRVREQNLSATGLAANPRRSVHRRAEIVAAPPLRLAGVQAEARPDVQTGRPRLDVDGLRRLDRGADGVRCRCENRDGRVALPHRLEQAAADEPRPRRRSGRRDAQAPRTSPRAAAPTASWSPRCPTCRK